MTPYKFPSPAFENQPAKTDEEKVIRTLRGLQYQLADMKRNDFNFIASDLNRVRAMNGWMLFPPGSPAKTPRRMLEIVTGRKAEDIISALKVIAEENWRAIAWIESEAGIAIESENLKRGGNGNNQHTKANGGGGKGRNTAICSEGRQHTADASGIKRRLHRKNPELLRAVLAGEMSVNQAAIAAGMRQPKWSAPIGSAEGLASAIVKRFGHAFAQALAEALTRDNP